MIFYPNYIILLIKIKTAGRGGLSYELAVTKASFDVSSSALESDRCWVTGEQLGSTY